MTYEEISQIYPLNDTVYYDLSYRRLLGQRDSTWRNKHRYVESVDGELHEIQIKEGLVKFHVLEKGKTYVALASGKVYMPETIYTQQELKRKLVELFPNTNKYRLPFIFGFHRSAEFCGNISLF